MNNIIKLCFLVCFPCCCFGQTAINLEFGREVVWQNGFDSRNPTTITFSIEKQIINRIGGTIGFRRSFNSQIGPSNASNASSQIDSHYAIREFGESTMNELFLGAIYQIDNLSLRLGLGFLSSYISAENIVVRRDGTSGFLLDEQNLAIEYDARKFWRTSAMIRYNVFSKYGFSLVPFVEFMHDFRSSSNIYSVKKSDRLRTPFDGVPELTNFRSEKKLIYQKPDFFNVGIALQYTW